MVSTLLVSKTLPRHPKRIAAVKIYHRRDSAKNLLREKKNTREGGFWFTVYRPSPLVTSSSGIPGIVLSCRVRSACRWLLSNISIARRCMPANWQQHNQHNPQERRAGMSGQHRHGSVPCVYWRWAPAAADTTWFGGKEVAMQSVHTINKNEQKH